MVQNTVNTVSVVAFDRVAILHTASSAPAPTSSPGTVSVEFG